MDKDYILNQAKSQMNYLVKNTTLNNLAEQNESLSKYFQFLEILNELETVKIEKSAPKRLRLIKHSLKLKAETEKEQIVSMSDLDIDSTFLYKNNEPVSPLFNQIFTFERKLRGGVIRELEGGYAIPEKMVRDIGLDNLDKVKITSFKEPEDNDDRTLYWFEIVEKVNAPLPNRIEYKFCKVEKDFGEFLVRSSHEGDIRIEDIPYNMIIKNEDVLSFNLKEGDIVDIAFYKNNPNTVKVSYKYETNYSFLDNDKIKITNTPSIEKKNNKSTKQLLERNNAINKSLFKDRKVLIVGGATRKSDYKVTFEKVGADFEQASGDEHRDTLSAMISKAEVVGIAVGQCSHNASIFTVETCKRLGIPFSSTHQEGLQSMLLCVEEAMLKGIKDDLLKVNDKAI